MCTETNNFDFLICCKVSSSHTSPVLSFCFLTSVGSIMCCVFMKQKNPVMASLGSDWQSCCHIWDNWCSSCYHLYIGWHIYHGVDSFTNNYCCLCFLLSKIQTTKKKSSIVTFMECIVQLWCSITYRHSVQRYSWTFLPGKHWEIFKGRSSQRRTQTEII